MRPLSPTRETINTYGIHRVEDVVATRNTYAGMRADQPLAPTPEQMVEIDRYLAAMRQDPPAHHCYSFIRMIDAGCGDDTCWAGRCTACLMEYDRHYCCNE